MKNFNLNFGANLIDVHLLPLLKQVITIVHISRFVKKTLNLCKKNHVFWKEILFPCAIPFRPSPSPNLF